MMQKKVRIIKIEDITDEFEKEWEEPTADFYSQFDEDDFQTEDDFYDQFDEDDFDNEELDFDEDDADIRYGEDEEPEFGDDGDDFYDQFDDEDFDDEDAEDENFSGIIRTVKGAALAYKRETGDGTFEELWVYNSDGDFSTESEIKSAILAGTDIDESKLMSDNGEQKADLWTVGNVTFLKTTGLPQ
jgi:hypothetical protein